MIPCLIVLLVLASDLGNLKGVDTVENKNLLIAVALSLLVLFGWGRFAEYMGWVKPPVVPMSHDATREGQMAHAPLQQTKEASVPVFPPGPGRDFVVSTPLYEATFYTGGGQLKSFVLKDYHTGILPDSPLVNMVDNRTAAIAPLGLVLNSQPSWSTGKWQFEGEADTLEVAQGDRRSFTIAGEVDGLKVHRHFTVDADTYLIREKITLQNPGGHARSAKLTFTQAMDSKLAVGGQYDAMRIAWDDNGSLKDETSVKTLDTTGVQASGKIYWAGPMNTYFLAAAIPANPDGVTVLGRLADTIWRVGVVGQEVYINPGQSAEIEVSWWTGPKDRAQLAAVSEQLTKSIDLGMFSIIAKGIIWLLEFFQKYVHNWGVAIILLSVAIKAVFWPLNAKSYASMEKMKQLQPLLKNIQNKYKGNREEMNKEVMALYKTYKVNPASGCVPILIQMPVFFGLYQALLTSLALRHASFITYFPGTDVVWLADLSAKDPLYITPILMGISMFLQQRMSPPPTDPMQRKVMMFLPLIFTFIFLNFPSGLVLYWLVQNVLGILQQWLMIRKNKKPQAPKTQAEDLKEAQEN